MSRHHLSRRDLLRSAAAGTLVTMLPSRARAARSDQRPNILVILADDMGFSDIGCYGSEIETPNIDQLAAGGLRFTQFYNTARCCPTRACLLTGLYPHQAGVGHMVENRGHPSYQGHLNDSCVTIAEALRPAGYRTLMAGKWHVGSDRPHWPTDRGFDRYYGLVSGGSNYFKLDKERVFAEQDRSIDPTGGPGFYMTNAFTDRALAYLDETAQQPNPFFMYLAYTAPHWPLHALPEDIARFRGRYRVGWDAIRARRLERQRKMNLISADTSLSPRDARVQAWESLSDQRKDAMDLRMAVYAAQIYRMDANIGRVVARLKETGQYDNTLILFLADNGGCAEIVDRGTPGVPPGPRESFLSYGLGWANASNTPFRMYKHWVHEGGISSPLVAHWPGRIQSGTLTSQVGHLIDLMPTCLELAQASYPRSLRGRPVTPLEGRSLLPVLRGQQPPPRGTLFWEHEGNRAVRKDNWKLVAREGKKWELYDIATDRAETKDLSAEKQATVQALAGEYHAWAKRCNVVPWNELNRKSTATKPGAG